MNAAAPKHLVVDARTVRPRATGVGHYTRGLLLGLDAVAAEAGWKVTALCLRRAIASGQRVWLDDFRSRLQHVNVHEVDADYERHPSGDLWLQRDIDGVMEKLRGDVLLCPAFICPFGRRRYGRIVVIHDSAPWELPENYPQLFRLWLRTMSSLSARFAESAVTVSPPAAERLGRVRPGGREQFAVVPSGIDTSVFRTTLGPVNYLPDGTEKKRPLIVYPASFELRKNHEVLFEAMRVRPLKKRGAELVLIHDATPEEERQMLSRAEDLAVRIVRPRDDEDMAAWLRCADAAAFPSKFEGFGLPVLEAMACGTPVVTSTIDAYRWLTQEGQCSTQSPPDNMVGWSTMLSNVLSGSGVAEEKVEAALRRAEAFSWERTASQMLEQSERALARR